MRAGASGRESDTLSAVSKGAATDELVLSFESVEALRDEYEANLRHGRAFVAGAGGVERLAPCTLRLAVENSADTLALKARVVLVSETEELNGVALELAPGSVRQRLTRFVENAKVNEPSAAQERPEEEAQRRANVYAQRRVEMRKMSIAERSRVAHGANADDRVLLERMFGTAVWEMLLRSPTITPPEVANIARKGGLSIPLIELVTDHPGWIHHEIVRRALLNNPRTPAHCILKVLRATPRNELQMILEGAVAYPKQVRTILNTLKGRRS